MRGCGAASGRADAAVRPSATSQGLSQMRQCGVFRTGPVATAAGAACSAHPQALPSLYYRRSKFAFRGLCTLQASPPSAGGDPSDLQLSPDEEAAYQEMMQKRKAERKAWKMEMRRRAKFDPLSTPQQPQAPSLQPPASPALAGSRPPGPGNPAALSRPAPPQPPPIAPARLPQTLAAANIRPPSSAQRLVQAPQLNVLDSQAPGAVDEIDTAEEDLDADAMTAMARKLMKEDGGGEAATAVAEAAEEEDEEVPEAVARGRSAVAASSSGRGATGAGAGTAATRLRARRAAATAVSGPGAATGPVKKRQLMPISQLQRQQAVAGPAAGLQGRQQEEKEEEEEEVQDDGLDWDALQAYEQYEQYVNEVAEEEQRGARRRAAAAVAAARSAKTAAASPAAPAVAAAPSSSRGPASAVNTARAEEGASGSVTAAGRRTRAGDDNDPADRLGQQLDRWEQLINFFEVVERDGKREEARKRRRQSAAAAAGQEEEQQGAMALGSGSAGEQAAKRVAGGAAGPAAKKGGVAPATAAGVVAAGAVASLGAELGELGLGAAGGDLEDDDEAVGEMELDWQSVEKLFLGEGWESELADLKAKVEQGARDAEAALAAQESDEGPAVEPWRDEVSSLLLGLVEMSAKRYLGRSLLAEALGPQAAAAGTVAEEERAAAFWEAPFLLLVQDDSSDPLVEYANRSALDALRLGSFEEVTAGLQAASLTERADPRAQQEWLWACTEATERAERYSTIPSLRLRGPGPDSPALLATDVTVFCVDSLEGQPVGQAILATSWKTLPRGDTA